MTKEERERLRREAEYGRCSAFIALDLLDALDIAEAQLEAARQAWAANEERVDEVSEAEEARDEWKSRAEAAEKRVDDTDAGFKEYVGAYKERDEWKARAEAAETAERLLARFVEDLSADRDSLAALVGEMREAVTAARNWSGLDGDGITDPVREQLIRALSLSAPAALEAMRKRIRAEVWKEIRDIIPKPPESVEGDGSTCARCFIAMTQRPLSDPSTICDDCAQVLVAEFERRAEEEK